MEDCDLPSPLDMTELTVVERTSSDSESVSVAAIFAGVSSAAPSSSCFLFLDSSNCPRSSGEQRRGENSRGEGNRGDERRGEQGRAEEMRAEESRAEESRAEESREEESRGEMYH